MNFSYDPTVDALTLRLSAAPVEESDEVAPGIILDYDESGQVIGIEVLDVSKRSGKAVPIQTKLETVMKQEEDLIIPGNVTVRAGRLEFSSGHSEVVLGNGSTIVSDNGRMRMVSERTESGVHVFSHVTERPVEESINLKEEHVTVERYAVNRPVEGASINNVREGVIEVTETSEVPAVSKEARIIEEVVVGKVHTERIETVRDTVRRTDVEVEQIAEQATDSPKQWK